VNQAIPQLITAALVGAMSPIATMATIAVLSTGRRPLVDALSLLLGWTIVLVVLAGAIRALLPAHGSAVSDQTRAVLNVFVGVLLLSFGLRQAIGARHPLAHVVEGREELRQRPPGWMRAFDKLTPLKAVAIGAVLLLVSPADLAVYMSALQGVSGNDFTPGTRFLLVVSLVVAIDLCILIPLGIYVVAPRRAQGILTGLRGWLIDNSRRATASVLLIFGLFSLGSGISALV
jgi:sulfite exporter TauE/SafE